MLKFRYVVVLEQSFPMSTKSKRSGGNLQYLVYLMEYCTFNDAGNKSDNFIVQDMIV
ncbi:hypothetical protein BCR32DRAFT_280181 [Anaeromyces robustus]|uniref:Uncharacterized protein n=1 Tax=Anaeromyces robustus TaxID=1754192 RepID=A0A1Y1X4Y7_9FUNG|nr:hypothetical protein BCR32DRAFT_280181 [Anaeromyces robustus]|eukprot:ORX80877.1 hypothetical protein BCR32DRAFT_280181 [Anaeromyces robustus]